MAVRRRRPLVPPPYPRRNRYTPLSSEQSPLVSVSAVSLRLSAKTALAPLLLLFPSQTLRWFVMGALGIWAKSARLRCPSSSHRKRCAGLRREPWYWGKVRSFSSRCKQLLLACDGNVVGCKESSILGSLLGYLAGYQWRL